MITLDNSIIFEIIKGKMRQQNYPEYLLTEIKESYQEETAKQDDEAINYLKKILLNQISENFENKRNLGENDHVINKIIQNDSIEEFTEYVKEKQFPLDSHLKKSIYETNLFLLKQDKISLIEYCAFFGAMKIINFLNQQKVKLPSSLWIYGIHSNNLELLQFLEKNKIKPKDKTYTKCLIESIKCHHDEMTSFIMAKYMANEKGIDDIINIKSLKFYNFYLISIKFIKNTRNFFYLCKFDYVQIVQSLLNYHEGDLELYKVKKGDYYYENTALNIAIEKGNVEIVQLLLSDMHYNPNILGKIQEKSSKCEKSALHIAIETENVGIVEALLSCKRFDVNLFYKCENYDEYYKIKKTALHTAVEIGNTDIIQLLLSCQLLDINTKYKYKKEKGKEKTVVTTTALNLAIQSKKYDIIQLLLSCPRYDVNTKLVKKQSKKSHKNTTDVIEQKSPLQYAIEKDDVTAIKLLLECESLNINLTSTEEKENLYESSDVTQENEIVYILGEPITVPHDHVTNNIKQEKTYIERTIVQFAIEKKNYDVLKLLLNNNSINLNIFNNYYSYDFTERYETAHKNEIY